ncbi:MAG: GAP family protein [Solirubrobacteraceae bacterium]
MRESNGERARRGYSAALNGDIETLAELLNPEVTWHGGDPTAEGACHNRRQALTFISRAVAAGRIGELVEVTEAGDQVLVVMRPRTAPGELPRLAANLTTFHDGHVVEMVHYADPDAGPRRPASQVSLTRPATRDPRRAGAAGVKLRVSTAQGTRSSADRSDMGSLLGLVLPLAAGAAVSPTLLAVQLVTLSRRTRPLARSWAVAVGAATVLAGVAVAALLLAKSTGGSTSPSEAGAVVKLAAAGLLAALGTRTLLRGPRAAKPERVGPHPLRQAFLLGAVLMLTNFSTIALFFPAIHAIGISTVAVTDRALAFALLFLITLLPVLIPPLAVTLLGQRATPALHALNRFFVRHHRSIDAGICFAFAALLAIAGLHALLR